MIHLLNKAIASALTCASLLLLTGMAAPSAAGEISAFDGPASHITLPGKWSATVAPGVVVYRNTSAVETLTVETARQDPFRLATRAETMAQSVTARRARERHLSKTALELTAVTRERAGAVLRMRYAGTDLATRRRFVNLMVSSPDHMRNFYYEAVGLSQQAFDARAAEIFGGVELGQPLQRLVAVEK